MSRLGLRRIVLSSALVVAVTVAVLGGLPSPASAHAVLVSSSPANGAVEPDAPSRVRLTFNEPVVAVDDSIAIFDGSKHRVATGSATAVGGQPETVMAPVPPLADGIYVVLYRVTSEDGHPVSGSISFVVGNAAPQVSAGDIVAAVSDSSASRDAGRLLTGVRVLAFVGLLGILGGLWHMIASATAGGAGLDDPAARRWWWTCWLLAVVSAAGTLLLQVPYTLGGAVSDVSDTGRLGDVLLTRFGAALLWRAGLLIAFAVLMATRRFHDSGGWRATALVAGAGLAATFSVAGHPSTFRLAGLGVAADTVHVLAAAFWIGGLLLFVLGGRAWLADDGRRTTVEAFSHGAPLAVAALAVTGVFQGWRHGGLDVAAGYRSRLLLKIALVVALVGLGWWSRRRLSAGSLPALRRGVLAEAVVAVAVLAVTSSLVATPPARVVAAQLFQRTLVQGDVIADVVVTPGRVGDNEMHVTVTTPGGTLQPVQSVTVRLSLPDQGVAPLQIDLVNEAPNHFSAPSVVLPFAGTWTMELILTPAPNQTVLLRSSVPIPG